MYSKTMMNERTKCSIKLSFGRKLLGTREMTASYGQPLEVTKRYKINKRLTVTVIRSTPVQSPRGPKGKPCTVIMVNARDAVAFGPRQFSTLISERSYSWWLSPTREGQAIEDALEVACRRLDKASARLFDQQLAMHNLVMDCELR